MTLSVAVVIVNFNSGDLLEKCLLCLSSQVQLANRVIVVDNSSGDTSAACTAKFDWVELIELDVNCGFAAASNLGVRHATGCDWVALLNPDAFAEHNWLAALTMAAEASPNYASFASRMMSDDRRGYMDGAGDAYHISGRPRRISHGKKISAKDLESRDVFGACAGAALYRRQTYLDIGGLDEEFFCYLEDVDLSFRLQMNNHKCLYVADAVVNHVGSAITVRGSDFQVYHAHRNIVWVYLKNMPLLFLILALPLHIALNFFSLILFLIRGQGRVLLRSKFDAVKGLPLIFRKRSVIMASRSVSLSELLSVISFRLR
jgi:GT2 family glycosyltransferase